MFDANNIEGTLTNHQHMERFSNDTCFSCCHVGIRVIRRFVTWSSEQELKRLLKVCKARHVLTQGNISLLYQRVCTGGYS
jgi:hypothetical protein